MLSLLVESVQCDRWKENVFKTEAYHRRQMCVDSTLWKQCSQILSKAPKCFQQTEKPSMLNASKAPHTLNPKAAVGNDSQ